MHIRLARYSDLDNIVNIHLKCFQGFFLSSLGFHFLKILYSRFLSCGYLKVCVHDNTIVGFVAGVYDPPVFFSKFRNEKWFQLLIVAIPAILKQPLFVIKRFFFSLFYKGDRPELIDNAFLISSIAVDPIANRSGCGKNLIGDLILDLYTLDNFKYIYCVTDKFDNAAVLSFYFGLGFSVFSEFKQPGGREMLVLVQKLSS